MKASIPIVNQMNSRQSQLLPFQVTHYISDLCVVHETPYCSDVNSTPGFWESVSRPAGQ